MLKNKNNLRTTISLERLNFKEKCILVDIQLEWPYMALKVNEN